VGYKKIRERKKEKEKKREKKGKVECLKYACSRLKASQLNPKLRAQSKLKSKQKRKKNQSVWAKDLK